MKPIGGYFGLELQKGNQTFHTVPAFKSGRSALHFILKIVHPTNVYIPFYTCDGLLDSFEAAGVLYRFYAINDELEPQVLPDLKEGEYFLYINYFGLKDKFVDALIEKYQEQLIIDCSQAFFYKGDGRAWAFNSCRKFFGVPDGGYLYSPKGKEIKAPADKNVSFTFQHLLQRFNGNIKEGYTAFVENEALCNADLKSMSVVSEYLLSNINYNDCIEKRRENFNFLHQHFSEKNLLKFQFNDDVVPMVYPLLLSSNAHHQQLWKKELFVPVFWKDVLERENGGFETEKKLSRQLLPLPIDHRYTTEDMQHIVNLVNLL